MGDTTIFHWKLMINHGFGVSNFKINPHVVLVPCVTVLVLESARVSRMLGSQ